MTKKLLDIKNLRTCFYEDDKVIAAVDDVSLFVNKNSVVGLVGESGCGKTMTALSVTQLLPRLNCKITSGMIRFNDQDLLDLDKGQLRSIRGKEISYIFQEPSTCLNPVLTVEEQMQEVVSLHRQEISREDHREFIIKQLKDAGINMPGDKVGAFPHQLSGGEKQRVMIAMAMIPRPKLLIADEPTTALDVTIQAQILRLLQDLKNKYGMAILLISHDFNIVGQLADYIAVMYAGQIVEFSSMNSLMNHPNHPYTKGLLDCLPDKDISSGGKLNVIEGEVPRADSYPCGCRFHPRCPYVFDRCKKVMPPIFCLDDTTPEVRCWLYSNSKT